MNDIDTSTAPGAAASVVKTVLEYAASPWKFAALFILAVFAFSAFMVYVEREVIATRVLQNLGKPRLDLHNAQKIIASAVKDSRAKYAALWEIDLDNNLQRLTHSADMTGDTIQGTEIGYSAPIMTPGSNVKVAAALMNGQAICFDPRQSDELPHKKMVANDVVWVCASTVPSGLGAFVGLLHIMYLEKPDQSIEQAALRSLNDAATKLTVR
jgi:hypothetical protein